MFSKLLRIGQRRRIVIEKFMTRHAMHTRKFTAATTRRSRRVSSDLSSTGAKS